MPAPRKYPPEVRERAMRLVVEAREQDKDLSLNAAVLRIGPRVGVNGWCKQADIDAERRPGITTVDGVRIKDLERENRELKRANEMLLAASSFFARELGRHNETLDQQPHRLGTHTSRRFILGAAIPAWYESVHEGSSPPGPPPAGDRSWPPT